MNEPDRFDVDGVGITVSETTDALTYTFRPSSRYMRPGFPFVTVFVFTALPLVLLGLVAYALDRINGNRPEWELALTGVFVVQLVCWFVLGIFVTGREIRSALQGGTRLIFTPADVR